MVRLLHSAKLYSGAVSLRLDRFSLGEKVIEKEIVEHQPSVGIVPVLGSRVILVTQYRRAAGTRLMEIPAGKVEHGESPLQAARREMAEEIGYSSRLLRPLVRCYLAPGYDTEFMIIYVATKLEKVPRGNLDDDENDISINKVQLKQAVEMCYNGKIRDCKTIAGLLAYSAKIS